MALRVRLRSVGWAARRVAMQPHASAGAPLALRSQARWASANGDPLEPQPEPTPSTSKYLGVYDLAPPDQETAARLPLKFRHVSNEQVFSLAIKGHHGATRERLVRNIMAVDGVDWQTAREKVEEMNVENDRFAFLAQLPYTIGVVCGLGGGMLSVPLVFYKPWVIYFAEHYVKMDPSEIPVDEMTSVWTVGSFSWGYAEPVLGTLSFVLLAAQFVRSNMVHMALQPYTNYVLRRRALRLCRLYPRYDRNVVSEYATTDSWHK